MTLVEIRKAPQAFRLLNGIVCLYKDRLTEMDRLSDVFRSKLAEGKNQIFVGATFVRNQV